MVLAPALFQFDHSSNVHAGVYLRYFLEEMQTASDPRFLRYLPEDVARDSLRRAPSSRANRHHVVMSSFDEEEGLRFIELRKRQQLSPIAALTATRAKEFLQAMRKDYDLVRAFGKGGRLVHDLEYIRPNIWVWRRKAMNSPSPR